MMVFRHNETCISRNGAIYKLIIVGISFYQIEMEIGRNEESIRIVHNHAYGKCGKLMACFPFQYFNIFFQYFIGYTKLVASVE